MVKHLTMNLVLLLMSKDSYTNISWMLVKGSLLWSFLNLGNIQYLRKLMTNWVTKVIHAYIVSSNANIIGRGFIANCVLCQWEKAKVQQYPLQMTEIPDRPFDKIAIDLVTECKTSTSGNKCILTLIDHLTGWPEEFPIPDKSADTIVATFINEYLPVYMCPQYRLLDNGTEFKNSLMDQVLQQLVIDRIFSAPYHPKSSGKLEVFHKYLKPTLKKLCEKDAANWVKYLNQVLASYRITPNLATAESPFFLVYMLHRNISCKKMEGVHSFFNISLSFHYFTGTCQLKADWLRLFL